MKRLLLALVCAVPLAAAPAVFDNPPTIIGGQAVAGIRTGHFDGDAYADFIALSFPGPRLEVYPGNGDGTFDAPVGTQLPPDVAVVTDFAVDDVDGDGHQDVVVSREADWNLVTFQLYRGNGTGSFTAASQVSADAVCAPTTFALAEMTGDGRRDIVTCRASVLPNLGGGNFGAPVGQLEYQPTSNLRVHAADHNGDGKNDIFVHQTQWTVYHGNGDGTVQLYGLWAAQGPAAFADFDLDGKADIAWLDPASNELSMFRSAGASQRYSGGYFPRGDRRAITTADINGDGRPDVLASFDGHVYVWITTTDATSPAAVYIAGSSATQLATADFNGDGARDVLAAGYASSSDLTLPAISLLTGAGGGTLRAMRSHLLARKLVNSSSPVTFPRGVAVSDVTGDGHPDGVTVGTDAIAVFPGSASGIFGAPVFTAAELSYFANTLYGDFDGNGALDLMAMTDTDFDCWLANGDGTYRKTAEFPILPPFNGGSKLLGDFNGDGKLDFVQFYTDLRLYLGNGDGTFAAPVNGTTGTISPAVVLDLNLDGKDDLVFWDRVLFGTAGGAFTPQMRSSNAYHPSGFDTLADLNADGRLDAVHYTDGADYATLLVRLRNADGTFGAPRRLSFEDRLAWQPLYRGVAGDFNGDGNTDLAFDERILLGDGTGLFTGFARFRYGSDVRAAAAGDLDGNGSDDLVYLNDITNALDVARTRTASSLDLPLTLARGDVPATMNAGQEYTITATASGMTLFAPSGAVLFSLGGEVTAMAELTGGQARGKVHSRLIGTQTLTVSFGGDERYASASAPSAAVNVTKAAASLSLQSTQPALSTQPFRVWGRVYSSLPSPPTGTVTLLIDGTPRDTQPAAEFELSAGVLPVGTYQVRVEYSGDADHLPVASSFSVTVRKPAAPLVFTINPPHSSIYRRPITLTASFPSAPGITGVVRFEWMWDGQTTMLGDVTIANGQASLTTTLPIGHYILRATYLESADYRSTGFTFPYSVYDGPFEPGPTSLYVLTPCRLVDTRGPLSFHGGPALPVAGTRSFPMTGHCGIPEGAKALVLNVTVVTPPGIGFLTLFPGSTPNPGTSTINYRTGRTRANHTIASLSAGGVLNVMNGGGVRVHVIIDVTGYFQ